MAQETTATLAGDQYLLDDPPCVETDNERPWERKNELEGEGTMYFFVDGWIPAV